MSWSLKKILKTRVVAGKLVSFQIGDGKGTLFWKDPWLGSKGLLEEDEFKQLNLGRRKWATVRQVIEGACHEELRRSARGWEILDAAQRIHLERDSGRYDEGWSRVGRSRRTGERSPVVEGGMGKERYSTSIYSLVGCVG